MGYRSLVVAKQAGDESGKTIARVCKAKRLECFAKHENDVPALRVCLTPCKNALERWVKYARPSLNAALAATFAGLEVAYHAKKSKADWMSWLKPGVCGLLRMGVDISKIPELAKAMKTVLAPVKLIEGLVCNG
jgi:hypothetical protein